jgi:hypothetical protein
MLDIDHDAEHADVLTVTLCDREVDHCNGNGRVSTHGEKVGEKVKREK